MATTHSALSVLRLCSLVVATGVSLGCPTPENPCDDDRLGCDDNTDAFVLLDCTVDGAMTVVPGQGERSFVPLAAGNFVDMYYGTQGGRHMFAAFRLLGADPVVSPMVRANFVLYGANALPEGTSTPPEWCATPPLSWPTDEVSPVCWSVEGERTVVLGARDPLRTNSAGEVEEAGLLLRVYGGSTTYRFSVRVEDQCGRTAEAWVDVAE